MGAFDIRFDGHAVLSCEMKTEAMAHDIHSAAKTQELDIWSHSVKVVRAAANAGPPAVSDASMCRLSWTASPLGGRSCC